LSFREQAYTRVFYYENITEVTAWIPGIVCDVSKNHRHPSGSVFGRSNKSLNFVHKPL
jgi:hypothetical protein